MKQYRPTRAVLADIGRALAASRPSFHATSPLEGVVDALYTGRHYFWIGIYLRVGNKVVRQCFRGPVPPCHSFEFGKGNVGTAGQTGLAKVIPDVSHDPTYRMCFRETQSEIVVPIKIGTQVFGVIDAEQDCLNGFGSEEHILLTGVARVLARFLATRGQYLLHRASEHDPASRGARKRAAAGETETP